MKSFDAWLRAVRLFEPCGLITKNQLEGPGMLMHARPADNKYQFCYYLNLSKAILCAGTLKFTWLDVTVFVST